MSCKNNFSGVKPKIVGVLQQKMIVSNLSQINFKLKTLPWHGPLALQTNYLCAIIVEENILN